MTEDRRKYRPPAKGLMGIAGNERIGAFTDGVFAIAITLLVLALEVPDHVPAGGLQQLIPELVPKFAGHVISFAVLGVYWIGHHNMFLHIHRHDRTLLWLNILFLLFVASMPFTTGLLATYGDDHFAVLAYAANLVLAGLALDLIWVHATRGRRLVDENIDPDLVAFVHRRVLMAPAIYLLAIGVSFFSVALPKLMFAAVVVIYIVPSPLDTYHHKQLGASE